MRGRRRIVLIKIITHKQLWAHWETYNKAEMACLFSLCSLHSSKFWDVFWSFYLRIFSLTSFASCTSLPELVFDIQKLPPFLPFWIIEIHLLFFSNHMRNPESFLTRSLRRIRLSNLWKCKHCGWTDGVCWGGGWRWEGGCSSPLLSLYAQHHWQSAGLNWLWQWITNITDERAVREDDHDTVSGNAVHI